MTQKPSSLLNTVHIISDSNSATIEFKPNFVAFLLMLFGLRLSAIWLVLIITFIQAVLIKGILIIMLSVAAVFVYFIPYLFIKKIILTKDNIEFTHYGFLLKNISFRRPREVNFTVKPIGKKLKIEVLDRTFLLNNSRHLPIITDEFSRLLKLEFVKTKRIFQGSEILVFRRK
jgi:hypothetical protein